MLKGSRNPIVSHVRRTLVLSAINFGSLGSAYAQTQADTAAQPATDPSGEAVSKEVQEETLEEVVVKSRLIFKENDAFGATKMGISVKETPQSVVVVTKDLIESAAIKSFSDFYKVDASTGATQLDHFPIQYYRGFEQSGSNAVRMDGFRLAGAIDLDMALFDRFEVVKGPTSTLYGQNALGGSLNAVSKLPQDGFAAEIGLEGGQFNAYRFDADVTGPLAGNKAWSYRLIGAYSEADSFVDFNNENLKLISSSVAYQPSDATRFLFRTTWQSAPVRYGSSGLALQLAGTGTGAVLDRVLSEGLKIAEIPRSRFFGMPWMHGEQDGRFAQFQGEHTFENSWQLRTHAQYNRVRYVGEGITLQGPLDENGFAYFTSPYGGDYVDDLYGAEVNLFGKVELFGRKHTLFFGADYSRIGNRGRTGSGIFTFGFEGSAFNAFHPDYSAVPRFGMNDYTYLGENDNEKESYGATVQLILNPADRLKVLLAGRYSVDTLLLRGRSGTQDPGDNIEDKSFTTGDDLNFNNITFQTGVTYELTEAVNLYASYGETFEPKLARKFVAVGVLGKLIGPEEGTNYEIGAKADLSEDLALTLAVFQMERTNITQRDRAHRGFSLPLGTQRSRGVELGAQGRVSPPLSLFGSLAYMDADFSEGEFKGLQPANAPRFGLSVFGSYEILEGDLKGLGFSLGAVYKSGLKTFDSFFTGEADTPVTFDFGSFTEVNAQVYYGRNRWEFALSASNLFNEKYYTPAFSSLTYVTLVNPPRTIGVSVHCKFGGS